MDGRRRYDGHHHPGRDHEVNHQFHQGHLAYNDQMMERERYERFMSRTSQPSSRYHGGMPYYGNQGVQGSPYLNWQGQTRDPSHAQNTYHPQVFPNCYGQTNFPSGQTAGQFSHFGYEGFGNAADGMPMHSRHSLPSVSGANDSRQGFWNNEAYGSSQARICESRGYPPPYDTSGGNAGLASSQVHQVIESNINATDSAVTVSDRSIRNSHNTESHKGNLPLNYDAGCVTSGYQLQLESSKSDVPIPSVSSQSYSLGAQLSNRGSPDNVPLPYSSRNHTGGERPLPCFVNQEHVTADNCGQHYQTKNVPDSGGKRTESHCPSKHSSPSVREKPSTPSLQGSGKRFGDDAYDQLEGPVDQDSLNVNRKEPSSTSHKSSDHPVKIPQAELKNDNVSTDTKHFKERIVESEKMLISSVGEHETKMENQGYVAKNCPEIAEHKESDSPVSSLHDHGDCSAQLADTRHEVQNLEETGSLQDKHVTPTDICADRHDVKQANVPKKTPPKSVRTTVDLSASELGCSTLVQFEGGTCTYIQRESTGEKEEGTFYCYGQRDEDTELEPRVVSPQGKSPPEIEDNDLPIATTNPQSRQYHDDISMGKLQTMPEVKCRLREGHGDGQSPKELECVLDAPRHFAVPVAIGEHSTVMVCNNDVDALPVEAENRDFINSSKFNTRLGPNDDVMFDRCPSCCELVACDDMVEHSFKCKVSKPDPDEAPGSLPVNLQPPNDDEAAMNCPECGVGFQTTDDLVIHLRIHEMLAKNAKKIQEADQMMLMTEKQMTEMAADISEQQPEECDVCYEVFTDPTMIPYHKMMHQQFPFHCRKCNLFFSTLTELYKSRCADQKRHKVFKYRCERCKGVLLDSYKMRKHRKRCEGKMETCRLCQEKFPSFRQLAQHAEIFHNEKMSNICMDSGEINETNIDQAVSETENTDLQDGNAQDEKVAVQDVQDDEHVVNSAKVHQISDPKTSDSMSAGQDLLQQDTSLEIISDSRHVKDEIRKTTYENECTVPKGPGRMEEPTDAKETKTKPSEYGGVILCKICGKELPMSHRYHGRACKEIPEYCKTCSKTGTKRMPSRSIGSEKEKEPVQKNTLPISDSTSKEDSCDITTEPFEKKRKKDQTDGEICGACGKWFKNFSKLEKHAGKCDGVKNKKDRGICQDSPNQDEEINMNWKSRDHEVKDDRTCSKKESSQKMPSHNFASETKKEQVKKRTLSLSNSSSKHDTFDNKTTEPFAKKQKKDQTDGETCSACGKWFKNFSKLEKHAGKCDGIKKQKGSGIRQDFPKRGDENNLKWLSGGHGVKDYKMKSQSLASETNKETVKKRTLPLSVSTSKDYTFYDKTTDGEICGACGKWFKNFSKLEKHAGKCDGVKNKKDRGICQDSPNRSDEINLNWKYPTTHQCPNCKRMFSKEKRLKKHRKTCLWIPESTSSEPGVRSKAAVDEVSDQEDELLLTALENSDDVRDAVRITNADDVVNSLVSSPIESVETPIEDNSIESVHAEESNQLTMNKEESDQSTCDVAVGEYKQELVEMKVPDKSSCDIVGAEFFQVQVDKGEPSQSKSVTETIVREDSDGKSKETEVNQEALDREKSNETVVDQETLDRENSNETVGDQETLDREKSNETVVDQEDLDREKSNETVVDEEDLDRENSNETEVDQETFDRENSNETEVDQEDLDREKSNEKVVDQEDLDKEKSKETKVNQDCFDREKFKETEVNQEALDREKFKETEVDQETFDREKSNETVVDQDCFDREKFKETEVNQEALDREKFKEIEINPEDLHIEKSKETKEALDSGKSKVMVNQEALDRDNSKEIEADQQALDRENSKEIELNQQALEREKSREIEINLEAFDRQKSKESESIQDISTMCATSQVMSSHEDRSPVAETNINHVQNNFITSCVPETSSGGEDLHANSGGDCDKHVKSLGQRYKGEMSEMSNNDGDLITLPSPASKQQVNCSRSEIVSSVSEPTKAVLGPARGTRDTSSDDIIQEDSSEGNGLQLFFREPMTPDHLPSGGCPMINVPLLKANKNTEMDISDSAHCITEETGCLQADLSSPSAGADVKKESYLAEKSTSARPEVKKLEHAHLREQLVDSESVDQSVSNSSEPEQASGVADDTESLSQGDVAAGQPLRKSVDDDDDNTISSVSQTSSNLMDIDTSQTMSTNAPVHQEPAQTLSQDSSGNTTKGSIEVTTGIEEKGHFSGLKDKSSTGSPLKVEYTMGLETVDTISLECETIPGHHCVYCAAQFPSRNDLWNHARGCRDNHLMLIANRVAGEADPTKPGLVIEPVVLEKVPWQVHNDYTNKEAMVMRTEIGIDLNCVVPAVGYKHPPNKPPNPQTAKHKKKKKKKKIKIKEDVEKEKRRMIERKKRRERDVQREKIRVQAKLQQLEQKKFKRMKTTEQESLRHELCDRSFHSIDTFEEHKISHVTIPHKKALTVSVEKLKMGEIVGSEHSKPSRKHLDTVKYKEKKSSKRKHSKVSESKPVAKKRLPEEEDLYVDVVSLVDTPASVKNLATNVLKSTGKPDTPVAAVVTSRTATGNVTDTEKVVDTRISHGNSKAMVWKKNEFGVQFPVVIEVECPDCQMKFSHQSTLDRHRRLHRK
ncbi:uncharacterized protein LOC121415223 [Lytechinus variegatus]|uniref:uncharacterized protein LOC121415223 n=1 Tax=Lytechinus variegatus TaxID=7654 RepID=UPI001BB11FDF|nr:uncharacterized protein LOC121415223 [Lytechinus variegatus]